MSKISFELSVKILGSILLVGERMQAHAILSVLVEDVHFYGVFADLEVGIRQSHLVIVEDIFTFNCLAIDL